MLQGYELKEHGALILKTLSKQEKKKDVKKKLPHKSGTLWLRGTANNIWDKNVILRLQVYLITYFLQNSILFQIEYFFYQTSRYHVCKTQLKYTYKIIKCITINLEIVARFNKYDIKHNASAIYETLEAYLTWNSGYQRWNF